MAGNRSDRGAPEGWAATAGLMLLAAAIAWWRRWRRDPTAFRDGFRPMPSDWRSPPPSLPPRR